MKLVPTRRTDYAVRALVHLAHSGGAIVKAADIAAAMDIPTGFLHQVLQELHKARLVSSQSGPSGGYALTRLPEDITICEVVEALEGPIKPSECSMRGGPCYWEDVCALHWVWSTACAALRGELEAATVARVASDDRALAEGRAIVPPDAHRRRNRDARRSRRPGG